MTPAVRRGRSRWWIALGAAGLVAIGALTPWLVAATASYLDQTPAQRADRTAEISMVVGSVALLVSITTFLVAVAQLRRTGRPSAAQDRDDHGSGAPEAAAATGTAPAGPLPKHQSIVAKGQGSQAYGVMDGNLHLHPIPPDVPVASHPRRRRRGLRRGGDPR